MTNTTELSGGAQSAIENNRRENETGTTIVELLVAMVIFLIVTGSIYGLLRVAQGSRSLTNQKVSLNKNVRVALNLAGRDTLNAGLGYSARGAVSTVREAAISTLLGVPADTNTLLDTVPPVIAGNNLTLNQLSNARTDQVTFLSQDTSFNVVNTAPQPIGLSAVNNATLTLTTNAQQPNSPCRRNDIYLITGNNGQLVLGVATAINGNDIQFAENDVLGFNRKDMFLGMTGGGMKRINIIKFAVTPDGILTRSEYANTNVASPNIADPLRVRDEPLVYNVEDYQITYGMDDASVSVDPGLGISQVRQVNFSITVRGTERDATGNPYRLTMNSTYSTRNLGY